jgi:hypothetical protein
MMKTFLGFVLASESGREAAINLQVRAGWDEW